MVFQCLGLFGGSGWADSANSGMFVSGARRIVFPTVIDTPFVFEPPPCPLPNDYRCAAVISWLALLTSICFDGREIMG